MRMKHKSKLPVKLDNKAGMTKKSNKLVSPDTSTYKHTQFYASLRHVHLSIIDFIDNPCSSDVKLISRG